MFVSCNENFARGLGIRPEEITGKTDYDFYPKELADKYRADDRRIMASGRAEEIEEKHVKQGQELIVQTVKTPVRDEHGNTVGILCIFWDITERKQAQEKIEESEKRYRTLFEDSLEAMSISKDGRIADANQAWLRLHGFDDLSEVIGIDIIDIVHPEDRDFMIRRQDTPIHGQPHIFQVRHIRKDGSAIHVESCSSALWLGGEMVMLSMVHDVSERLAASGNCERLTKI